MDNGRGCGRSPLSQSSSHTCSSQAITMNGYSNSWNWFNAYSGLQYPQDQVLDNGQSPKDSNQVCNIDPDYPWIPPRSLSPEYEAYLLNSAALESSTPSVLTASPTLSPELTAWNFEPVAFDNLQSSFPECKVHTCPVFCSGEENPSFSCSIHAGIMQSR